MKTAPITVRFEAPENSWLATVATQTGFPVAELIRRSVRLMQRETTTRKDLSVLITLPRAQVRPHHHSL